MDYVLIFVLMLLLAATIAVIVLGYYYTLLKARMPVLVQREFNKWKGAAEFEMQERIRNRVEQWREREAQTILADAQRDAMARAHQLFRDWCQQEMVNLRREQRELAEREAQQQLIEWKQKQEQTIRQDAIQRSQSVTTGKIVEHLVPHLPNFNFNPKDARFLGSPVDFVVFDGLNDDDENQIRNVVFIEVKTGMSTLTRRERLVRDAIKAGRVRWVEWNANRELQQTAPGLFE